MCKGYTPGTRSLLPGRSEGKPWTVRIRQGGRQRDIVRGVEDIHCALYVPDKGLISLRIAAYLPVQISLNAVKMARTAAAPLTPVEKSRVFRKNTCSRS